MPGVDQFLDDVGIPCRYDIGHVAFGQLKPQLVGIGLGGAGDGPEITDADAELVLGPDRMYVMLKALTFFKGQIGVHGAYRIQVYRRIIFTLIDIEMRRCTLRGGWREAFAGVTKRAARQRQEQHKQRKSNFHGTTCFS
ncbi:hypothetical protein D3C80_1515980 [compost metagenome]